MPPPKRMTANPARPARHRAGKPTGNESSSESDSDAEAPPAPAIPAPPKAASAGRIISNLNRIDLDARRKELESAAERRRQAAQRAEKLAVEQGFVTEEEEDSEEGEEDGESESEAESESSEEEEAPRRGLMLRPKFVPKSQRGGPEDPEQQDEAARRAKAEAKKKAADELVEEQIKKDLAARAAGKKHWDDEENEDSDVDTTDGLDPEAEEAAWRVRELKRLKRARTAIEEREKELAEVERRRNLTAEERAAEDEAHLARQREDKESKGKMSYMQKYYHKGAFFQEETEQAGLLQRDIMGSRFQDDVRNRENLPEYLQRRDMTRLGRKGATRYKDMRSEDTGRWGDIGGPSRGPRDRFDGDERFRPDDDGGFRPDERGAKGANAVPLGERRAAEDAGERGERRRSGGGERQGSRDDYRRRRVRSRTPRRDHDDDRHGRKRSTSRDGDGHDGDKRRRVDVVDARE